LTYKSRRHDFKHQVAATLGSCFPARVRRHQLKDIQRLDDPAFGSEQALSLCLASDNAQRHQVHSRLYDLGFIFCNSSSVFCVSFSESYTLYMVKFKSDVLCRPNASWLRAAHFA
jgi:hypothetical protein